MAVWKQQLAQWGPQSDLIRTMWEGQCGPSTSSTSSISLHPPPPLSVAEVKSAAHWHLSEPELRPTDCKFFSQHMSHRQLTEPAVCFHIHSQNKQTRVSCLRNRRRLREWKITRVWHLSIFLSIYLSIFLSFYLSFVWRTQQSALFQQVSLL